MKDMIRKFALKNAIKFNGKPSPGAVIGMLIQEDPSVKKKLGELQPVIQEVVKEVSKMKVDEQLEELKDTAPSLLVEKKKERKTGLKELENVGKKVVMRFAPSPSGPMHIGHSYALSINSEYCRKYKGKLVFRIEDTNPENIYPPAYDMIPEEAKWLTKDNVAEFLIQSDRLDIYYRYAEEVINNGHAYVCTCPSEEFREMKLKMVPCHCRGLSAKENMDRWKKMFKGYKEGEAVLRIKTNIKDKNPAMRDWPAVRINDAEHPRVGKKYRVWPLMNFAVTVDDIESKMTHVIRAKDHADNARKQEVLYDYLGKKAPESVFVGKINFVDMKVKCSLIRPEIDKGTYSGWDDIRLPFLAALRRRGYQPEAFIKYAMDVGVTQNDKSVNKKEFFKSLDHFNTEILEPKAKRFFIVRDPVKIKIDGAPSQEVILDSHPENRKIGKRKFKVKDEFYIEKFDVKRFKDKELVRLMDCLNFVVGKKYKFDSTDYEKYKENGKLIIHWLPADDTVDVTIAMPDGGLVKCKGESGISKLKEGDVIQAERFGFLRLDSVDDKAYNFWFTHN